MKSLFQLVVLVLAIFSAQTTFAQNMSHKGEAKMVKHTEDIPVIKLSQVNGAYEISGLNLVAGDYIFEITNRTAENEVAFLLTTDKDQKTPLANAGLPGVLKKGETARTGVVTLKPGNYKYSCPINPTPKYALTVK